MREQDFYNGIKSVIVKVFFIFLLPKNILRMEGLSLMGCLGNLLWFVFGGVLMGLSWFGAGILWCITIVGIPIGVQCFKFAKLAFFPFGKDVLYGGGAGSLVLNIIWMVTTGFPLALEAFTIGLGFCVTIIGIPFGLQCFKIAKLALMPFGSTVID